MNVLSHEKQIMVLQLLLEGCSIRSTERVTKVHRDTITRLMLKAAVNCRKIMDSRMRDLDCDLIQLDEVWCFVGKKQHRIQPNDPAEFGHTYTYIAIDPITKLIPCYLVGKRDEQHTWRFVEDLSQRLRVGRVSIFSDGFRAYNEPVRYFFRGRGAYGQVVKKYSQKWIDDELMDGERRYSPVPAISMDRRWIWGPLNASDICTSHVERVNLTLRMGQRRWTRLTNAFSKKLTNLKASADMYFAYYNFCRVHGSLSMTPAMAHGISSELWSLERLIGLW